MEGVSPSKRQRLTSTQKQKTPGITPHSYDKFDVPVPIPPPELTPGPRRISAGHGSAVASSSRLTLDAADASMDDDDEVGLMLREAEQPTDVEMSNDPLLPETVTPPASDPDSEDEGVNAGHEPTTPRRSSRTRAFTADASHFAAMDATPRSKPSRTYASGSRSTSSARIADQSTTKSPSKVKELQSTPRAGRNGRSLDDILTSNMSDDGEGEEDEDILPPPRRSRPVLLGYKQWAQRDPKVDREWRAGEKRVQNLAQKYGEHPFDWVRNRGSGRREAMAA